MRLFMALDVPGEVAERIDAVRQKLIATRADVRWVEPALYHLTVKFLGDVDDGLVGELSARLDRVAAQVPTFTLKVEGIDRLPEKGPVRVIVSRMISADQRMTKLHRLVNSAVGGIGLPMDTRVLVPHLTLGRVASNHGLNRMIRLMEKHYWDDFGSFVAERVRLVRSHLGGGAGPRYETLHEAAMKVEKKEAGEFPVNVSSASTSDARSVDA